MFEAPDAFAATGLTRWGPIVVKALGFVAVD
jgi:hypothetical protein